jgi:hypothetical protein
MNRGLAVAQHETVAAMIDIWFSAAFWRAAAQ